MTDFMQSLKNILASLARPRNLAATERGVVHDMSINQEVDLSKKHLEKLLALHANDENDDGLKQALRQFFRLRWAYIRNTSASYDQYIQQPVNEMNAACIKIATAIATPDESLAQILMPTLSIKYYASIDETLQSLTESEGPEGQRTLDLKNIIVSHDGKSVISLDEWFDDQKLFLAQHQAPHFKTLYRIGVDGSDRLLTTDQFNAVSNTAPYNACSNYANYLENYKPQQLSDEDLKKIAASLGESSQKYIADSERFLKLIAKPCTFYEATEKLCLDLKKNGVKGEGKELVANQNVYPLIEAYFKNSYDLLTENEKRSFSRLPCGDDKTFGAYLLMLKSTCFALTDTETAQLARDRVFTCIDLASNAILEMLNKNEAVFKKVDARASVEELSVLAMMVSSNLEARVGVENLANSLELLTKSKKGYGSALNYSVTGQGTKGIHFLMICHEAFDENQFKEIRNTFSQEEANHCWEEAETEKELYLLAQYMTQYPVHKLALCAAVRTGSESLVNKIMTFRGFDINASDRQGMTALQYGVKVKNFSIISQLLQAGADFSGHYGDEKKSLLYFAVFHGFTDIAVTLIEKGADLNERFCVGRNQEIASLLCYAIAKGRMAIVQACFTRYKRNSDAINLNDASSLGLTAIHYAALLNMSPLLKELMDLGARLTLLDRSGRTPLHLAIFYKHREVAEVLLSNKLRMLKEDWPHFINAKSGAGFTAIAMAIDKNMSSIALRLIEEGADLSFTYRNSNTLLMAAINSNMSDVVDALISKSTLDLNAKDSDGFTALHCASRHGKHLIVKSLLEKGADISIRKNDGWTALHLAVNNKYPETVEVLLSHQSGLSNQDRLNFINAKSNAGDSAISLAIKNEMSSTALRLIEEGADLSFINHNDNGNNLLMMAIWNNMSAVADALISVNTLDLNATNSNGWTGLHCASRMGNSTIVKSLLDKGANIKIRKVDRWTALHLAISNNHRETVEVILSHESRLSGEGWLNFINAKNNDGDSAIGLAINAKMNTTVLRLIEEGADLSFTYRSGNTLLMAAINNNLCDVVHALISRNTVDLNAMDSSGWTAIHSASRHGKHLIVKSLLEKGVDISIRKNDGWTALHLAVSNTSLQTVQILLGYKPYLSDEKWLDFLNGLNHAGQSPLQLAMSVNHPEIAALLVNAGAILSPGFHQQCLEFAASDIQVPFLKNLIANNASHPVTTGTLRPILNRLKRSFDDLENDDRPNPGATQTQQGGGAGRPPQ